jgi:hypothetical protein
MVSAFKCFYILYMCMCLYKYICTHIYTYTYVYISTHTHTAELRTSHLLGRHSSFEQCHQPKIILLSYFSFLSWSQYTSMFPSSLLQEIFRQL